MNNRKMRVGAALLAALLMLLGGVMPARAALVEDLGVVIGGRLHLRAGPSLDAEIIGTYDSGTHVRVLGVAGAWYEVEVVDGHHGYMEAAYVYVTARGVVENGADYVNLRSEPSRDASVIGRYGSGTALTLLSENTTGWCFVDIDGVQGYMAAAFIQPLADQFPVVTHPFAQAAVNPYGQARSAAPGQGAQDRLDEGQEGALYYSIAYPYLNIEAADRALADWTRLVKADLQDLLASLEDGVTLSLSAQYELFETGTYIGVLETGLVDGVSFAHPWDVVYTMNVDASTGSVLRGEDIYVQGRTGAVLTLLAAKLAELEGDPAQGMTLDDTWLTHTLLTPQGVMIVLPRGVFIPSAWGTQYITLAYDVLRDVGAIEIAP